MSTGPIDRLAVSPTLSATRLINAVPARDTKPAPSAVTSTFTRRPSRITFKVNPQTSIPALQQHQESLSGRTFPRPRVTPGARVLLQDLR